MKVSIIGSTNPFYEISKEEALDFSGKAAGICYMPDDFRAIWKEPVEVTEKRINQTLRSKHHSVYDHVNYNLLFEDIPKFIAMVLNNESMYTTSEKSARYTRMKPSPREMELYNKWLDIFNMKISEKYPQLTKQHVNKLAQENARYMISVFTPTTMMYTVSLRQLNYIMSMMKKYILDTEYSLFNQEIKSGMFYFLDSVDHLKIPGLEPPQVRSLSLFDRTSSTEEHFGETYCVSYTGSFAQLAQAQRHRTLDYKMSIGPKYTFYTPELIKGDDVFEKMWSEDMMSLESIFPQGMLVNITERGTYENFILKAMERLCGCAQLEIMQRTLETMIDYYYKSDSRSGISLEYFSKGYYPAARCKFPGFKCPSPCVWGPDGAISRLI